MLFGTLSTLTLLGALVLFLHLLWMGNQGTSTTSTIDLDEMRRHIVWRSFYVNPNDPRGWVPKTSGWGMTVNFRTLKQAHVFAGLVAFTLLCSVGMTVAAFL